MKYSILWGISLLSLGLAAQKHPDYSDITRWAAHPDIEDGSDRIPEPLKKENPSLFNTQHVSQKSAVFYVYPTIYEKGDSWSADIDDPSHRKDVQTLTLPNQVSVFTGLADVYAPYYRQMKLDGYYTHDAEKLALARVAFDTAYADVVRAFLSFYSTIPSDQSIIIASHSQGTDHCKRLIREHILPFPDRFARLEMAYLVGMPITARELPGFPLCESPLQTGCYVSWRTYGQQFYPAKHGDTIGTVNPITWTTSPEESPLQDHMGILFKDHSLKHSGTISVQIQKGTLQIADLDMPFKRFYSWKNYHVADYNLFWLNIRSNFHERNLQWHTTTHPPLTKTSTTDL